MLLIGVEERRVWVRSMSNLKILSVVLLLGSRLSSAQSTSMGSSSPPQSFEAATLKLAPADHGYSTFSPWGAHQFRAENVSLNVLLSLAYGVDSRYISGIPKQLNDLLYTVAATPPGEAGLTYEQIHLPLQQLLVERLHLAVHFSTTGVRGYLLVAASGGTKLIATKEKGAEMAFLTNNEIRGSGIPLKSFAGMVSSVVGKPVEDGLRTPGNFIFDLHFSAVDDLNSDQPSLLTALEEQYGLKLVGSTVKVQTLIVDHADLRPSED